MPDKITLLPDKIANQIAAGEVIQRPASAVKELLENAVDAGATEIHLIVADAGKSLLQVIDNGSGMSETDARMCFERHATSKIKEIDDLFHIHTMGFRGEALASIAAVAQVELKTKRQEDDAGTLIEIENSEVKRQEPVAAANGTSIAMKNLFFSVPARRNFLKSNTAEMRHVVDEFTRVAMAFPHIRFSLTSNGQQLMHLDAGSLKQRIVQLLGNSYTAKLVSVKEDTDYMNIHGFIGKPEIAKKTRGDQYFFVNNRFIKSPYLHHAVMNAYQDLIPADSFPTYVLLIDLDPAQVDVNVHPTKQEIKFEDEKITYAFVQSAVKHSLAQYSITPTLDFDLDASIQQLSSVSQPFTTDKKEQAAGSSLYKGFTQKHQAHFIEKPSASELQGWKTFYNTSNEEQLLEYEKKEAVQQQIMRSKKEGISITDETALIQIWNQFILVSQEESFLLVNQKAAHERVLYDQMQAALKGKPIAMQQSLFPATHQFSVSDAVLLRELLPDLRLMGFNIDPFGNTGFIVQGTPADLGDDDTKELLDFTLEQYKHFNKDLRISSREKLIRSLARQRAMKHGTRLMEAEMRTLLTNLFSCEVFNTTPDGNPTYLEFKQDQIERMFGR